MQDLIILTSPPATGKTFWISTFKKALGSKQLLVISPLRALADECRQRWGDSIVVMTPEEWLGKKFYSEVIIFDEFHLFFYWGDTFRPLMWEAFFEMTQNSSLSILLTATLGPEMQKEISLFACHFDSVRWIDCGNQVLKYKPVRYLKAPSRNWIMKEIESQEREKEVRLIFCKYRNEVFELEKHLTSIGYTCLSCVGGESRWMKDKLKNCPSPDFIISTTVLSHGVNLPDIKKIFFLFEVQNIDFWIQMVARGGRRGESFEVFSLERPQGLDWNSWQNFMHILWLSIKQKFSNRVEVFLR